MEIPLPTTLPELHALIYALLKRDAERELELIALRRENEALRARVAELEEQLKLNPRNSSKPPSSEPSFLKPKPKPKPKGRKRGAQPGHKGSSRQLLPDERVHEHILLPVAACAHCGDTACEATRRQPTPHQVIDFEPGEGIRIRSYQRERRRCTACGQKTTAPLPDGATTSYAPGLAAFITFLTGRLHLSKLQVVDLMQQAFHLSMSPATVCAIERAMSQALEPVWDEALEAVQATETGRHADETGWPQRFCGGGWLWVLASTVLAVFRIDAGRTKAAATALVGETVDHPTVTDRFISWQSLLDAESNQLCWAHLLREFRAMSETSSSRASRIGEGLLKATQRLFGAFKRYRAGPETEGAFEKLVAELTPVRARVEQLLRRGLSCGVAKYVTLCEQLLKKEPQLWVFLKVEGLAPDNNLAERLLRQGVLWRKGSFGTDSEGGSRFVERILTVIESLRLQKRPLLDWLRAAFQAHVFRLQPPSLLPA